MRQPFFLQKKDGTGLLRKTINGFCHSPKQTKNDQETYGCIHHKLSEKLNEKRSWPLSNT